MIMVAICNQTSSGINRTCCIMKVTIIRSCITVKDVYSSETYYAIDEVVYLHNQSRRTSREMQKASAQLFSLFAEPFQILKQGSNS
jgi:hypothetical protein